MKALILTGVQLLVGLNFALSQEVISSASGSYSNFYGKIDFTTGESVIHTFSDGTNYLTQGFHQPQIIISGIKDFSKDFLVTVFPNPVMSELRINLSESVDGYQISVLDLNGKNILTQPIKGKENSINVSPFAAGVYVLILKDASGKPLKSYQIHKLN